MIYAQSAWKDRSTPRQAYVGNAGTNVLSRRPGARAIDNQTQGQAGQVHALHGRAVCDEDALTYPIPKHVQARVQVRRD